MDIVDTMPRNHHRERGGKIVKDLANEQKIKGLNEELKALIAMLKKPATIPVSMTKPIPDAFYAVRGLGDFLAQIKI